MELDIIVLYSKHYSFTDDRGKLTEGIKVKYLTSDTLEPCQTDMQEKGYLIAENSIATEQLNNIKSVPGIYKATFRNSVSGKGQLMQKLSSLEFISEIA